MIPVHQSEVIRNFCLYKDVLDYAWGMSNIDKFFKCSDCGSYVRHMLGDVLLYETDETVKIKYVDPHNIVSSTMEILGNDYNLPLTDLKTLNAIADTICRQVESGKAYVHYWSVRDSKKRHLFFVASEGKNRVRLFRFLGRQLPISITGFWGLPDPESMRIIHSKSFASALLLHDGERHPLPIPSLALPFWAAYGVPLESSLGWFTELLYRRRMRTALNDAMYSIQN